MFILKSSGVLFLFCLFGQSPQISIHLAQNPSPLIRQFLPWGKHSSIQPFPVTTYPYQVAGVNPSWHWVREAGYTLDDWLPVHYGAEWQPTIHTHTQCAALSYTWGYEIKDQLLKTENTKNMPSTITKSQQRKIQNGCSG